MAAPSPHHPTAASVPSTLKTLTSSLLVSPKPESPAQTFLLLSVLRPRVPPHLLGDYLISSLAHQSELPVTHPTPYRPLSSAAPSFWALRLKARHPFSFAADPSHQAGLPAVLLHSTVWSLAVSHLVHWRAGSEPLGLWALVSSPACLLSPAPRPLLPRGQRDKGVSKCCFSY